MKGKILTTGEHKYKVDTHDHPDMLPRVRQYSKDAENIERRRPLGSLAATPEELRALADAIEEA